MINIENVIIIISCVRLNELKRLIPLIENSNKILINPCLSIEGIYSKSTFYSGSYVSHVYTPIYHYMLSKHGNLIKCIFILDENDEDFKIIYEKTVIFCLKSKLYLINKDDNIENIILELDNEDESLFITVLLSEDISLNFLYFSCNNSKNYNNNIYLYYNINENHFNSIEKKCLRSIYKQNLLHYSKYYSTEEEKKNIYSYSHILEYNNYIKLSNDIFGNNINGEMQFPFFVMVL